MRQNMSKVEKLLTIIKQFYFKKVNQNNRSKNKILSMKYIKYDANEHNLNRMIQVQRQKVNHYKMLNTIYKKKSYSLIKEEKEIDKDRTLRINNQLIDKERKWRETQKQINYQNALLRNKLLQIYVPKDNEPHQTIKTNQSLDSTQKEHKIDRNFLSPEQNHQSRSKISTLLPQSPKSARKFQVERQIAESNNKIYLKLSNIQSQLMPKLKLREHNKEVAYLKQMLMKKSPKKNLRMKNIVQKSVKDKPKIFFPTTRSHRQITISLDNIIQQQPFVFY